MIDLPFMDPYESKYTARRNEADRVQLASDIVRLEELKNVNLGQVFAPATTEYDTSGFTQSTKSLNGMKNTGTPMHGQGTVMPFVPSTYNVDNKKIVDAKEIHNYPMDGYNNNSSHRQLSRFNNMHWAAGI